MPHTPTADDDQITAQLAALAEIRDVLWDAEINDWRELKSCADAIDAITGILAGAGPLPDDRPRCPECQTVLLQIPDDPAIAGGPARWFCEPCDRDIPEPAPPPAPEPAPPEREYRLACNRCGVVRWLPLADVGAPHCLRGTFAYLLKNQQPETRKRRPKRARVTRCGAESIETPPYRCTLPPDHAGPHQQTTNPMLPSWGCPHGRYYTIDAAAGRHRCLENACGYQFTDAARAPVAWPDVTTG
jgi:hypothetical protein